MRSQISNLKSQIPHALSQATDALLQARQPQGHWTGQLSASALSTATAVTALALVHQARPASQISGLASQISNLKSQIHSGLRWLAAHANQDGGWGDTTLSLSNLSTTTLCWAAFGAVPGSQSDYPDTIQRAESWLAQSIGVPVPQLRSSPNQLARAIIARYGKDRTFSVPILTMCALAGRLGSGKEAWHHVIPLPFELSVFPHAWFAALRLPVVSYALPALIAIGQARFHHCPPHNPIARLIRLATRRRSLRVLESIQPPNGGFLEATPLTSFVTMSLAAIGLAEHPVARRGAQFLRQSQCPDGSWPIDTNLATWVTTLAINALGPETFAAPERHPEALRLRSWLLNQQYRTIHPYTRAAPGGWAWTDLPGGVPDADDTAGALLALKQLGPVDDELRAAARRALEWLLNLQNRDGGIPTFCRGWGALPFDRSSADITAHAMRAWIAWMPELDPSLRSRLHAALAKAVGFLARTQRPDGSWSPLWFGNQWSRDEENPVYGTTRVVSSLAAFDAHPELRFPPAARLCSSGVGWLVKNQNADGGWGGAAGHASSVEETALAVEALGRAYPCLDPDAIRALDCGAAWLFQKIEDKTWTRPSPIGFYFAKLWYYEELYPIIFTVAALRQFAATPLRHVNLAS